ncbi:DUF1772 domain-containing protein [Sphaerisporangium flaviroseum]|uniref:DUF1772 domain-containing protein n=1 Tax=Sphaerisporangium flaviroseum TaxID=509199 RepID=A0ABP7JKH0_9ACTN
MGQLPQTTSLVAATITGGLVAGLFYSYACSVMPGLRLTDDRTFVETMQRINVAILNGWFFIAFLGTPVLIVLAVVLSLQGDGRSVLPWLVAALVLYGATLAVTFAVNVPMNNALGAAGELDRVPDLAAVRERFEAGWVRWNLVRTVTSTAAFGCLVWALVVHGTTLS